MGAFIDIGAKIKRQREAKSRGKSARFVPSPPAGRAAAPGHRPQARR